MMRHILTPSLAALAAMPAAAQTATPSPPSAIQPPATQPRPAAPASDADALAAQMRIIAAEPTNVDALAQAGELSARIGDLSGAASLFARAEKADPRNGRVKAGVAEVLLRSERPGDALRFFDQAEGYGYPPTRFAAERGLAYDLVGQQGRAQRDYRLVLAAGDDAEVRRRYALSLAISGQNEAALQQIEPLTRRNDRGAWRVRAFVLAMGGDVAGADSIATTMMAPGQAQGLAPFFARLASLGPVDRAFAVHFGELRPTPQRIADARLAPALPPLAPEIVTVVRAAPVAPPAPVRVADRRRGRKPAVQVAVAVPIPTPAPRAPAYGIVAAATVRPPPTTSSPVAATPPVGRGTPYYLPGSMIPHFPYQPRPAPAPAAPAAPATATVQVAATRSPVPVAPVPAPVARARAAGATALPGVVPTAASSAPVPATSPLAAAAPVPAVGSVLSAPVVAPLPSGTTQPAASAPAIAASRAVVAPPTAATATPPPALVASLAPVRLPVAADQPAAPNPVASSPIGSGPVAPVPAAPTVDVPAIAPAVSPVPGNTATLPAGVAGDAASSLAGDTASARIAAVPALAARDRATPTAPGGPAASASAPSAPAATAVAAVRRSADIPDAPLVVNGRLTEAGRAATAHRRRPSPEPAAAPIGPDRPALGRSDPEVAMAAASPAISAARSRRGARATDEAATAKPAEAEPPVDREAAARKLAADRRKAAADRKAAAEKAEADKEAAEERKAKRAEPERYWVQVAGGANEDDLPKAWSAVKAKVPALAGRKGWTTPLRATNRVVTGPFKTDEEARTFVNTLKKQGFSAFQFTSEAGQKIQRLADK